MSDETYRNMMGVGGPRQEVRVPVLPLSGEHDLFDITRVPADLVRSLEREQTILDRTIRNVYDAPDYEQIEEPVRFLREGLGPQDHFVVYVSPKADVSVATLTEGGLKMQLYSSGGGEDLEVPLFDVCYEMSDVPYELGLDAIVGGFIKAKDEFEGEFLFDALGKALRSHRNRVQASEVDADSLGSAVECIARTNHQPRVIVSNPTWFLRVNGMLPQFDPPLEVCCFSPKRRGNQKRLYVLDDRKRVGRQESRIVDVREEDDPANRRRTIRCWARMGCIVFDRDAIACIETT